MIPFAAKASQRGWSVSKSFLVDLLAHLERLLRNMMFPFAMLWNLYLLN